MTPTPPQFRLILSDFEWLEGDKKNGRKLRFTFEFSLDTTQGNFRFLQEGWVAIRNPRDRSLWVNPPFQKIKNGKIWCNSRISKVAMDIVAEALEKTSYAAKIGSNPFTNEWVQTDPKPWEEDPSLPSIIEMVVDDTKRLEAPKHAEIEGS